MFRRKPSVSSDMAVFLDKRGLGMEAVVGHLSPRCQRYLKRALAEATRKA